MTAINITSLLLILFLCINICATYAFDNSEQETSDDSIVKPYVIKQLLSFNNQHPLIYKVIDRKIPSFLNNHYSESTDTHRNQLEKIEHPVEYARSKRFWLFVKKGEGDINPEATHNTNKQQNSLTQGLWRSGIVGRRRRR